MMDIQVDITSRNAADAAFQGSNAQLQLLEACVSRLNDVVLITVADPLEMPGPHIVFVNNAFTRVTGYSREEVIGTTPRILQGPKTQRSELDRIHAALMSSEPIRVELINYTKSGQEFWFDLEIVPVTDSQGTVTHFVSVARDITERKNTLALLQASQTRHKVATESGRLAIWEVDIASDSLTWDDNCFALYKIKKETFTGKFDEWSQSIHPLDYECVIKAYNDAIQGSRGYHLIFRILWPDGAVRFIEAHGDVIFGSDGSAQRIIGVNWDITEQKNSEEVLRALVLEKTALLKEIHHRVKNNLQVITSLLRLEAGRTSIPHTRGVLEDMQSRIRAMSLLHESLYRSGTLAYIDLGSYLQQLSTQALKVQSVNAGAIELELKLDKVQVGMDQAISCGLLTNELISNCIKHAFPVGTTGRVIIELKSLENPEIWQLQVRDTGVGLPSDFEERRQSSLGLQLVSDLARQLGGELLISPNFDKGVSFSVRFMVVPSTQLSVN